MEVYTTTTYNRIWDTERGVDLDKQEALRILEEIKENINVCCAITMEPDEVLVLVDKLKSYINGK